MYFAALFEILIVYNARKHFGLSYTVPDSFLHRIPIGYLMQLLLRIHCGYTVPDNSVYLLRFQLHGTRSTPHCEAFSIVFCSSAEITIATRFKAAIVWLQMLAAITLQAWPT